MYHPFRLIASSLILAAPLAHDAAAANLVANPNFTTVSYSGSLPLTTVFGQFGTGQGSTLTLANWSTTGYNFLYAPGTADSGKTTGANTGAPNEAPGQYNLGNGYGSTYLYGSKNGGTTAIPTNPPVAGNFIAADGGFEVGAITQSISGLVVGQAYVLNFYWAAAQQESFTGATTENWQIGLGSQSFATPTYSLPDKGFSGWMPASFTHVATATTETLSFLAQGMPGNEPPFTLLNGVSLAPVPEPSAWMIYVGLGAACTVAGIIRRRRLASQDCTEVLS